MTKMTTLEALRFEAARKSNLDRDKELMSRAADEIAQLQLLIADDTGRWQDLWKGERAAHDRLRTALEWMRERDDRNSSLPAAYREKIDEALGAA